MQCGEGRQVTLAVHPLASHACRMEVILVMGQVSVSELSPQQRPSPHHRLLCQDVELKEKIQNAEDDDRMVALKSKDTTGWQALHQKERTVERLADRWAGLGCIECHR